jgi:hypothetical protein
LIQALAQGGLAFEQLLLIVGAHQEELAGGLEAGDARHGLGFLQQLRRAPTHWRISFLLFQAPQAAGAEQQHQASSTALGTRPAGRHAAPQALGDAQRPLRRAQLDALSSAGSRHTADRYAPSSPAAENTAICVSAGNGVQASAR